MLAANVENISANICPYVKNLHARSSKATHIRDANLSRIVSHNGEKQLVYLEKEAFAENTHARSS